MKNVPQRQAYGMALADYGDVNPDVVVLDADVSSSTLTAYFGQRHPTRFFNLGVTEASMVDVGVGFALGGLIPFVNTFAALLTLRACEQIRTCVAYANVNLKLVGGYAGLSDYKDGPTHFAVNDMALMRAMPNMAVVAPADNVEAARMVRAIAEYDGPVYMRISRADVPDVYDESLQVQIGKGITVRQGGDVTLISTGYMLGRCLLAADALARDGINARVLSTIWSARQRRKPARSSQRRITPFWAGWAAPSPRRSPLTTRLPSSLSGWRIRSPKRDPTPKR
jgi:transketolase